MHPYRPLATRLEAAADRHRVASTATRLLRGYYEATTRLLQGYYEATTRLPRGLLRVYYEATTRLLRGNYEATTWLLPGYYQATTWLLPGYHEATNRRKPRARHSAKQHRSSSTARLPAPLNPAAQSQRQRSALPHTVRKISRRPFSTCRTSRPTPESTHATRP